MKAPETSAVAVVVTETGACIGVVMTGGARAVCGAAGIVGGGSCGVTICGLTICGLTTFGVSVIAAGNRSSNFSAGFAGCSFIRGDLIAWTMPRANPSAPAQNMTFITRGRISVGPEPGGFRP